MKRRMHRELRAQGARRPSRFEIVGAAKKKGGPKPAFSDRDPVKDQNAIVIPKSPTVSSPKVSAMPPFSDAPPPRS